VDFDVTPILLLAVVIKGKPLDARLHNLQRVDLPMCIFTRNHLRRRDADFQRSAGTSPHISFPDALFDDQNTLKT